MVGQAWSVTGLIVAVVDDERVRPWALAVVGVFVARGLVGLVAELAAARAAGVVGTDVRRSVLRAVLSTGVRRLAARRASPRSWRPAA